MQLPEEILIPIFQRLDPIGLISASQTCTKLRRIIRPTLRRRHFVERLLELECTEEHGGPPFVFCSRNSKMDPEPSSTDLDAMRWACTGCLLLLPRQRFEHQSLTRLYKRKPIPGSSASVMRSTWEPCRTFYPVARAERRRAFKERRSEVRERYVAASIPTNHIYRPPTKQRLLKLQNVGMESFKTMSEAEFAGISWQKEQQLLDLEAWKIDLEWCGYQRRARLCGKCAMACRRSRPRNSPPFGKPVPRRR